MDMAQPGRSPEEDADAARAFEALRGEVTALRHGIELVYRQVQQAPAALDTPDYSPTLGAIAQELRAVGKRLDGMEAHPALQVHARRLRHPGDGGCAPGGRRGWAQPDARAGAVQRWAA